MKTLIIYYSKHHRNTEKIAKVIGKVLDADVVELHNLDMGRLAEYDLIGFGSGIYYSRHDKNLLEFANKLPHMDKKAFIFSTSGMGLSVYHRALKKKILDKGLKLVGEFSCKGFDTVGPFQYIGGINKGRPNEADVARAKEFAETLKNM